MKKSLVIKRSIVVAGHKTSVSLEDDFWDALKEIARVNRVTLSDLVGSLSMRNASTAIFHLP
jgi:predicted DNA-binding ribbon-helix-helix protein